MSLRSSRGKQRSSKHFQWENSEFEDSKESHERMSKRSRKSVIEKSSNKSKFIRKIIHDHLYEYKQCFLPELIQEAEKWEFTHLLNRSEKKFYTNMTRNHSEDNYDNQECIIDQLFKKNCPLVYMMKLHNMVHRLVYPEQDDYFRIKYNSHGYLNIRNEVAKRLIKEDSL